MKNKKTTLVLIVTLLVVLAAMAFLSIDLFVLNKPINKEEVIEEVDDITLKYKEIWNNYKEINDDYIGQIVFDSGLIDKPFVQATSCYKDDGTLYRFFNKDGSIVSDPTNYVGNDVYIWMDFETMEYDYDNKGGSIFMDYRNNLDDQNLIIYGHYFSTLYDKDVERVKAFTPLEKLLEESNYKDNSIVRLYLEDEIRDYELFAVYKFDDTDDTYWQKGQYFRTNYNVDDYTLEVDDSYADTYIDFVNSVKLYDTGVTLNNDDKTLTLQTCMTPNNNLYEICVFKLINTLNYQNTATN